MSGPIGDAANSLLEGYSKVDFNATILILTALLHFTFCCIHGIPHNVGKI